MSEAAAAAGSTMAYHIPRCTARGPAIDCLKINDLRDWFQSEKELTDNDWELLKHVRRRWKNRRCAHHWRRRGGVIEKTKRVMIPAPCAADVFLLVANGTIEFGSKVSSIHPLIPQRVLVVNQKRKKIDDDDDDDITPDELSMMETDRQKYARICDEHSKLLAAHRDLKVRYRQMTKTNGQLKSEALLHKKQMENLKAEASKAVLAANRRADEMIVDAAKEAAARIYEAERHLPLVMRTIPPPMSLL